MTLEQAFYWTQIALAIVICGGAAWGARWVWDHPTFQSRRAILNALKTATKRVGILERENKEHRFTIDSFDRSFKRLHDELDELRKDVRDLTSKSRAQIVYIVTLLLHIDGGGGRESIPQPPEDLKDDVDEALRKARGASAIEE